MPCRRTQRTSTASGTTPAIDEKAVWSTFSSSIVNYHFYCMQTRYFEGWCADDPTVYEEFKWLHARMQEIRQEEPDPDFLGEELHADEEKSVSPL